MEEVKVTKEEILRTMKNLAEVHGVTLTDNAPKIANAKVLCFVNHNKSYLRCPCDAMNENRYCISKQCRADIDNNGVCHCNCYKRIDKTEE